MVRYNDPTHPMMKTVVWKNTDKSVFLVPLKDLKKRKKKVTVLLWSWIENAFIGIIVFYPDIFDTADVCIHLF